MCIATVVHIAHKLAYMVTEAVMIHGQEIMKQHTLGSNSIHAVSFLVQIVGDHDNNIHTTALSIQ